MATLAPDFKNIADSLLEQVKEFDYQVEARSIAVEHRAAPGLVEELQSHSFDFLPARREAEAVHRVEHEDELSGHPLGELEALVDADRIAR